MTIDTIEYSNAALKDGKSILIEGANATSTYIAYLPLFFFIFDNSTYLLSPIPDHWCQNLFPPIFCNPTFSLFFSTLRSLCFPTSFHLSLSPIPFSSIHHHLLHVSVKAATTTSSFHPSFRHVYSIRFYSILFLPFLITRFSIFFVPNEFFFLYSDRS